MPEWMAKLDLQKHDSIFTLNNLHISHNALGLEANIRVVVTQHSKQSMFLLKRFYFRYDSRGKHVQN